MHNKMKGFTLVELLVVIAIIGLLSTIAIVSLGSARAKARDATRIADVKQITTALEQYYADKGGYPVGNATTAGNPITLGAGSAVMLNTNGFVGSSDTGTPVYMSLIPAYPTPNANSLSGLTSTCGSTYSGLATASNNVFSNFCYYTSTASGIQTDFRLAYTLDSVNSTLGGDQCIVTSAGTTCT